MPFSVPTHIPDHIEAIVREGRAIQGAWRKPPPGGKGPELVCALAAFGNGVEINSVEDCPAGYMPRWLAELIPSMDDGISPAAVPEFFLGLAERARRWSVISDEGWERVRVGFLVASIRLALDEARKAQPEPKPAYWDAVESAATRVIAALLSGDTVELTAARAATRAAAQAAAWAVQAAARAARAAAGAVWAVQAAARAADEAARAAAGAVWAVQAAGAARAAAWESLMRALFALLDAEIASP